MDQCEVYSSRSSTHEATVPATRANNHGKFKREQDDFIDDAVKRRAVKIPRQTSPNTNDTAILDHPTDATAMSVLPRLFRTMANRVNHESVISVTSKANNFHFTNSSDQGSCSVIASSGIIPNDADSSSSFISTPSPSSSIISFLSPSQLGPVAAMAAAALSTAVTTMNEISEPSGLVTLATASSLIEKEWLARAAFANNSPYSTNGATSLSDGNFSVQQQAADSMDSSCQSTVDHQQQQSEHQHLSLDSSPPILLKSLTSPTSQSTTNSTPVTRAVLNVQSLAAFIRETQKQCSSMSTPSTTLELPLTSVFSFATETKLTTSCTIKPVVSPSYLLPTSTPALFSMASVPQHLSSTLELPTNVETVVTASESSQPTAFISLQTAPGTIISPSDLQQLMASGEFMSSAARQTLLGQPPDGSTRQLYLLVPSDYPVIMPRNANDQQQNPLNSISPRTMESIPNSAPILEAISPGVEPDDGCIQVTSESSSSCNNFQSNSFTLPNLATAILTPVSSNPTALSTLLAGLEARSNQLPHHPTQYTNLNVDSNSATLTCSFPTPTSQTTDSLAPSCPKVRLPLHLSGLPIPEHGLLSSEQSLYPISANSNTITSLLTSVKTDPDMYTPNGHSYASLVDDANRFHSYATYNPHQLQHTSLRPSSNSTPSNCSNPTLFRPDTSSATLSQSCPVQTNISSNNNGIVSSNDCNIEASATLSRPAAVVSSNYPSTLSSNIDTITTTSSEECRRNSGPVLPTGITTGSGRTDQVPATYLEHLNPESKDIRRRVSHNEVERRRRDRINTWIAELYKLLPPDEQTKSQYQSKGLVLKRVCEYFQNVDSMLKTANAAIEQTRVENSLLRQRVRELQQDNQLLSASFQLGAAAAAAHLQTRQPRSTSVLGSGFEELNGTGNSCSELKESIELPDYNASVTTVFTIGSTNGNYARSQNFSQATNSNLTLVSSLATTGFPTPLTSLSSIDTFNSHLTVSASSAAAVTSTTHTNGQNQVICPLPLPSLDHMSNHANGRGTL